MLICGFFNIKSKNSQQQLKLYKEWRKKTTKLCKLVKVRAKWERKKRGEATNKGGGGGGAEREFIRGGRRRGRWKLFEINTKRKEKQCG